MGQGLGRLRGISGFNTIQSFFQEHVGEILILYPNPAKDGEEGKEFAVPSGAWGVTAKC